MSSSLLHTENEVSLRGATNKETESIATESVTYSPRYGYFLQMQHTTTKCPPVYGRSDGLILLDTYLNNTE